MQGFFLRGGGGGGERGHLPPLSQTDLPHIHVQPHVFSCTPQDFSYMWFATPCQFFSNNPCSVLYTFFHDKTIDIELSECD